MNTVKYQIGDTTTHEGKVVVIRKVIGGGWYRVSYGFDTKGNDIVGIVRLK